MGRTASSVGMMEGAFFVSRTELLEWVNQLLHVNLAKVEQCASGAIYCQIVDACYPGSVKMGKVNWMARSDHEFIPNYKILQAAFDRNSIQKHAPVDQLIRAKYQDNLEFLQWMKAMWDREGAGRRDYDPVKAREGRPLPAWTKVTETKPGNARSDLANAVEKENLSSNRNPRSHTDGKFDPSTRRPGAARAPPVKSSTPKAAAAGGAKGQAAVASGLEVEALKQELAAQSEELEEWRTSNAGIEKERDYYFGKLRNIEIMCETLKAKMDPDLGAEEIIGQIQGILYEEEADEEQECLEAASDAEADPGVAVA
jgi:RP/EB family microtubule-associated protein